MPNVANVKLTVGRETTPGTPVARTHVVPIRAVPSLDRTIEKKTDPVIVGKGMISGKYAVAADSRGGIPLSPRACGGYGLILKSCLGNEATPAQVAAVIRLRYLGSSASCKIATDLAAKTINAKIGAAGAEVNDASFGTAGTLTLTNVAHDTVGELVAAIEAYADYECKLLTGDPAATITSVVAGTFQAKGKWVVLILTGATSGAYAHQYTPNLSPGVERPALSLQEDGLQDNYLYDGAVVTEHSLSAALKGDVEGEATVLAMKETAGQVASVLTLPDAQPFIFGQGITSIGGVDYAYCRQIAAKMGTKHREDGYSQASLDRAFHQKDMFSASGDVTIRLDAVSILERLKVENGTMISVLLVFYAASGKTIGGQVKEMIILEVPFASVDGFERPENSGSLDAKIAWEALAPGGAFYLDAPLTITLITADSAAY